MAEKKQGPCTQWMHHKWLPQRKDLVANEAGEAEQTCKFCGGTRTVAVEPPFEGAEKEE